MASIVLYFHVHQPFRIKPYTVFQSGHDHDYFTYHGDSDLNNAKIIRKVAEKCYLPATKLIYQLTQWHPEFKVSYSISGSILDQFEKYAPDVLEIFQKLAATGNAEFLAETYHHSLSFLYSKQEFNRQVAMHHQKIKELFGQEPTAFRNTEFIYNNELAMHVEKLGYQAILAEGLDHILEWRNPHFVYQPITNEKIRLLLKNYKLSDDIAFRFSERSWNEWPLTAEKFTHWVNQVNGNGHLVNLFMDYETIGEHQWDSTGIFEFLKQLPHEIYKHPDNNFMTVTEAAQTYPVTAKLDMHHLSSWADTERDLSAWLSNPMQHSAIQTLYDMENLILETEDPELISDWRRLQTSDHFYYMCTKWWADGDVHKYFSPYESPYDAFVTYMNVLHDLRDRAEKVSKPKTKNVSKKKTKSSTAKTKKTVKNPPHFVTA